MRSRLARPALTVEAASLVEHHAAPGVTFSPTSGPAGTQLTVQATGFTPGETVVVTYKTATFTRT